MKKFSPLAEKKIKYYVYSLRCALTHLYGYVGKGKNSRVFEHRNLMHLTESRKNSWLRKNKFYEQIESTHETAQAAYEAEAAKLSMLNEFPELVIPGGLLNEQSGHHEISMTTERYEKLFGDKNDFDKEEVDKIFRKQNRRGVILNIVKSAKANKKNKIPYRELAFGYENSIKEKLHLTEEIFIRFNGSIVEHWINVKWKYDKVRGNSWTGNRIKSKLSNSRIIGPTRNSQNSTIFLNMDWNNHKKQLK
jgi:hypothetical protein